MQAVDDGMLCHEAELGGLHVHQLRRAEHEGECRALQVVENLLDRVFPDSSLRSRGGIVRPFQNHRGCAHPCALPAGHVVPVDFLSGGAPKLEAKPVAAFDPKCASQLLD